MNKRKTINLLTTCASALLWLVVWEILAHILDFEVIFPGPIQTFITLGNLITTFTFWKTVLLSIARILAGLLIGIAVGIIMTTFCKLLPFTYHFISIGMTVIKSTPVASIVLILWVIIGSASLPTLIGVLMVAPIVWQNLIDGLNSVDKQLIEVADVFGFSKKKRIKLIYLPVLKKYFIPALLTSIGLCWKSGIAAEIIAYTKYSIGKNIVDAKSYFEGDVMLAWTFVVVMLSLAFEYLVKFLLRRLSKRNA